MLLTRSITLTVTEKEGFSHLQSDLLAIGVSIMKRFKFHIFYSIFADAELNVGICKFTGDKCGTCDAQFISNSSIA